MQNSNQQGKKGTITLLGLGPGEPGLITYEASEWLGQVKRLYVWTRHHPVLEGLSEQIEIIDFDQIYGESEPVKDIKEFIITTILGMTDAGDDVTFAVPGDPCVDDTTCVEILTRAKVSGFLVKVIHGLSFLGSTFQALGIDSSNNLSIVNAINIVKRQTPGFSPSSPALISQINPGMAASLKSVLLSVYPDDHEVFWVNDIGTHQVKIEKTTLSQIDENSDLHQPTSLYIPALSPHASFESFQEVIARLRAPDGCPWDREQTHTSLRPFLIEEAYEALDALDRDDMSDLEEELGDLLLQIVLHAQIANEEGYFNIQQVVEGINTKLIRRHPHVFSEVEVEGVSGVIKNWEAIKAEERRENEESNKKGILDGVPKALPALLQAQEIVERVRRMGLNPWNEGNQLTDLCKMVEDYETAENSRKPVILGDILLFMAAIAHDEKIDLESALRQSLNQFRNKFGMMEDQVLQAGKSLSDLSNPEKAQLWQQTLFNEEDKSKR